MKSIKEIYKTGKGPSSSHTMGPERAAKLFIGENPDIDRAVITLYGSLAKTGKGHHTDRAIIETLDGIDAEIIFDTETTNVPHVNTLDFEGYKNGKKVAFMRAKSIGGGEISVEGRPDVTPPEIYPESNFSAIAEYCRDNNLRLRDYVYKYESDDIKEYLADVWKTMKKSIDDGLAAHGVLEGGLNVERKARYLFEQRHIDESEATMQNRLVCAYAFAVGEQNASCGTVVTAPTCGACSVLPAALKYMQEKKGFSDEKIIDALAVGGLIGCIVKQNASISGAECGCQAEMGTACSMTAAALCELYEMGTDQVEYAAEVAMEHHLGLTCDPIGGLVQIPCIERGAVCAMRAINACNLASFLASTRRISFDSVVDTMYQTGKDLSSCYRETSEGGLAKTYIKKKKK